MKAVCSGVGSIGVSLVDALSSRATFVSGFDTARCLAVGADSPPASDQKLLRVALDDELLADRQGHVLARGQLGDRALERVLVERDPLRHAAAIDRRERLVDPRDLLRRLA